MDDIDLKIQLESDFTEPLRGLKNVQQEEINIQRLAIKAAQEIAKEAAIAADFSKKAAIAASRAARDASDEDKKVLQANAKIARDAAQDAGIRARDTAKAARESEKAFIDANKSASQTSKQATDNVAKLGDAFKALSATAVFVKIKDIFVDTIKSARNFETQMLGLGAAARQSGVNFDDLKTRVMKLSEDGTLGVSNIATSIKMLLSSGMQVDQAFKFVEASRNLSALNNITGDTSQAVQDLVKGFLSGSQELVENADPNLKTLIKSLGGFEKVSGDAGKKQEFVNEVIKRGTARQGDYAKFTESGAGATASFSSEIEKLKISIGLTVDSPGLQNGITGLIKGFRESFSGLSENSQAISVFTGVIAIAIPSIVGFATAMKGLLGLSSLTSLLNPWALGIAAITLAVGGLSVAYNEARASVEQQASSTFAANDENIKLTNTVDELMQKRDNLKKGTLEYAEAEKKLSDAVDDLDDAARRANISEEFLNKSLTERIGLIRELRGETNKELLIRKNELEERIGELNVQGVKLAPDRTIGKFSYFDPSRGTKLQQELGKALSELMDINKSLGLTVTKTNEVKTVFKGITAELKEQNDVTKEKEQYEQIMLNRGGIYNELKKQQLSYHEEIKIINETILNQEEKEKALQEAKINNLKSQVIILGAGLQQGLQGILNIKKAGDDVGKSLQGWGQTIGAVDPKLGAIFTSIGMIIDLGDELLNGDRIRHEAKMRHLEKEYAKEKNMFSERKIEGTYSDAYREKEKKEIEEKYRKIKKEEDSKFTMVKGSRVALGDMDKAEEYRKEALLSLEHNINNAIKTRIAYEKQIADNVQNQYDLKIKLQNLENKSLSIQSEKINLELRLNALQAGGDDKKLQQANLGTLERYKASLVTKLGLDKVKTEDIPSRIVDLLKKESANQAALDIVSALDYMASTTILGDQMKALEEIKSGVSDNVKSIIDSIQANVALIGSTTDKTTQGSYRNKAEEKGVGFAGQIGEIIAEKSFTKTASEELFATIEKITRIEKITGIQKTQPTGLDYIQGLITTNQRETEVKKASGLNQQAIDSQQTLFEKEIMDKITFEITKNIPVAIGGQLKSFSKTNIMELSSVGKLYGNSEENQKLVEILIGLQDNINQRAADAQTLYDENNKIAQQKAIDDAKTLADITEESQQKAIADAEAAQGKIIDDFQIEIENVKRQLVQGKLSGWTDKALEDFSLEQNKIISDKIASKLSLGTITDSENNIPDLFNISQSDFQKNLFDMMTNLLSGIQNTELHNSIEKEKILADIAEAKKQKAIEDAKNLADIEEAAQKKRIDDAQAAADIAEAAQKKIIDDFQLAIAEAKRKITTAEISGTSQPEIQTLSNELNKSIADKIAATISGGGITDSEKNIKSLFDLAKTDQQITLFEMMTNLLSNIDASTIATADNTAKMTRTIEMPSNMNSIDLGRGAARLLGIDFNLFNRQSVSAPSELSALSLASEKADSLQEMLYASSIKIANNTEVIANILMGLKNRLSTSTNIDLVNEVIKALDEIRAGAI